MAYNLTPPLIRRKNKQFAALSSKLISLAGLIGCEIVNQEGQQLGTVVDLVFHWDAQEEYPPLTGVIARVARRRVWISAVNIVRITINHVELGSAKLDLREFKPREGEVRLAQEVIDHQLIDVDGARVVRASDLYVAYVNDQVRLVGVDVSYRSLFRRLGPRRMRTKSTPDSVIDWATIQSFGGQDTSKRNLKLTAHRNELRRLQPAELADLLEDLGRTERQGLLDVLTPDQAADALEEMQPEELHTLLKESSPKDAASYLMMMEPDEAADALRDMGEDLRKDLLARMPQQASEQVEEVLSYNEDSAGGIMNTAIITVQSQDTVAALRLMLKEQNDDMHGNDAIALVDSSNKFVGDIPLSELFLANVDQVLGTIVSSTFTSNVVLPLASISEVADVLIENRAASVVVVDESQQPIGRILADDILDFLRPEGGRFHFPRVLS